MKKLILILLSLTFFKLYSQNVSEINFNKKKDYYFYLKDNDSLFLKSIKKNVEQPIIPHICLFFLHYKLQK